MTRAGNDRSRLKEVEKMVSIVEEERAPDLGFVTGGSLT